MSETLSFAGLLRAFVPAVSAQMSGQLDTYVGWYAENMVSEGDSRPGLLLSIEKDPPRYGVCIGGDEQPAFCVQVSSGAADRGADSRVMADVLE